MESTFHSFQHTMKMLIFNQLKTNNPFLDAILTTVVFTAFARLANYLNHLFDKQQKQSTYFSLLYYFYKPNKIIISGKNCTIPSTYGEFYVSSIYSDRFNSVLQYIIANTNQSIHEMKELYSNNANNDNKSNDQYIVCQNQRFSIDPDIFFHIDYDIDTHEGTSSKPTTKVENITIQIYSYKYNIHHLTDYIDDITTNYRKKLHDDRKTKQFIYTAIKTEVKDNESKYEIWDEQVFTSNRTFDNLFLEHKTDIIQKVDFFLNNKEWYDQKGIPYNLGIGLHGKPGTGKTSFIKALANKTKRDIIVLPLKLVRTKQQLNRLFYESTYHCNNIHNSKTFDKKIIVFEDIDCIGEIVKKRDNLHKQSKSHHNLTTITPTSITPTSITTANNLQQPHEGWTYARTDTPTDPVTLDDFLNLWDGIRETPGRIIVITSNHYNQLDPALIRPGRIDLTYEFNNVSSTVLQDMHNAFFHKSIPNHIVQHYKPYSMSPAQLVNLYFSHRNDEQLFLQHITNS